MKKGLLIGDGLIAKHMHFLMSENGYDLLKWKRADGQELLLELIGQSDFVLLCISDDSIVSFYKEHLLDYSHQIYHFSGTVYSKYINGIHPMMTFSSDLYDQKAYDQILWMCDHEIETPFPFMSKFRYIKPTHKKKYHALCVASGNISQILWRESLEEFSTLGVSKEELSFYLQKNLDNFKNLDSSLTGPIVRGDKKTINDNLEALKETSLKNFYYDSLKVMETKQ